MLAYEKGVLEKSHVYFHTCSETAARLYLYPLCTGHFYCDENYKVERAEFDSLLLIYVIKGRGFAENSEGYNELREGDILLLNCYEAHCYGTRTGWEILWLHFNGGQALPYFQQIAQNKTKMVLTALDTNMIKRNLEKIYALYHEDNKANEAIANLYITGIMTGFLTANQEGISKTGNITDELLGYITENLDKPLRLEELAKRVSLSPYYFTRQFKKETGYTPHEYLIAARMNAAKFYLKTTNLPLKEITFRCGFSSESGFCTAFKKATGLTPLSYRHINEDN